MTAADKFGIAFSIGVTVVMIAFAMSFSAGVNTAPVVPAPMPVPPTSEKPMEEIPEAIVEEEVPIEEEIVEEVTEEEVPVEETEEEVEAAPISADVSIPEGSSSPGCEADNACYIESDITVAVGATVIWTNDDTAAHTVTSGTPTDGPSDAFDSSIIMSGDTFENTFEEAGEYDYFCIVHPWMTGKVTVE
jgi:plastocyanin